MTITHERLLMEARELHDTTKEICSQLELDDVLAAIVRRANRMLGGDVAYLATSDDSLRMLRMRASDNARSERFKTLAIPYGVGVGGAVADQRRPMADSSYFLTADPRVRHTPEVDRAASEEGLVGAAAAPVEYEDRLLAVLFVGTRVPREFDDHHLTLLSSLANAAAIAINNAQIHGRLIASMKIHRDLMEIALADLGPAAVARTLADLVNGPVALLDWQARPIAHEPSTGRRLDLAALGELSPEDGSFTTDDAVRVMPLRLGGQTEGYLVTDLAATENSFGLQAMEQASTVFALELAKLRSAEQAELRLRGGVITELLTAPHTDTAELLRQGERLGCDLRADHVVVVLRFLEDHLASSTPPSHRVAQTMMDVSRSLPGGSLAGERGSTIVVLTPAADVAAAQQAIERGLARCHEMRLPAIVAGLGSVARQLDDYRQSYAEALRAVDAARLKARGGVVRFDEFNFYELVLGANPTADLAAIARRMLGPLTEHDRRRGGELMNTLRVFLENNGNSEATARSLNLHANSLRARVTRIGDLLDRDLGNAETRLDLFLALRSVSPRFHSSHE